jgi:hypothetical protein
MPDSKPEFKPLKSSELRSVFQTWASKYGERRQKESVPYWEIDDMYTAMNGLILTLLEIGYDEDLIRMPKMSTDIQMYLTPTEWPKDKLRKWRIVIEEFWTIAVDERFPSKYKIADAQEIVHERSTIKLESSSPKEEKAADSLYVERPQIDLSEIKGLVDANDNTQEFDPLAFLKKGVK